MQQRSKVIIQQAKKMASASPIQEKKQGFVNHGTIILIHLIFQLNRESISLIIDMQAICRQ